MGSDFASLYWSLVPVSAFYRQLASSTDFVWLLVVVSLWFYIVFVINYHNQPSNEANWGYRESYVSSFVCCHFFAKKTRKEAQVES